LAYIHSMNKLLTTAEVGKRLGITLSGVRKLIARGVLAAEKIGRDYLIDPRYLPALVDRPTRHQGRGRPKNSKRRKP